MKTPEQMARIVALAGVETTVKIAIAALDRAPVTYSVPLDHPLALAYTDSKLALAKLLALTESTLKRLKR